MAERKNEAKWIESRQRWQINVQEEGERKTFTSIKSGEKGKIEAEKNADKWLDMRLNKDRKLEIVWEEYLREIKAATGTANYQQISLMGRKWLLPDLKNKKLSKISSGDWQKCIIAAHGKGKSKRTCTNIRAAITGFARYCKKNREPLIRPEDLTIPVGASVKERKILQPNDIKKLFAQDSYIRYGRETKFFFIHAWRLLVLTGLRRGELAGLQKGDLNGEILAIRRAVNAQNEITGGKNKNARRYIVLSKRQKDVLEAQAKMLKSDGIVTKWLFPDRDGGMVYPNHIYNEWVTFRKCHGIDSNLHEMRHTLISIAKADVPEQLLKRMVGHSVSMDTFGIYGHDVDGEMQRASDILSGVFDRVLE